MSGLSMDLHVSRPVKILMGAFVVALFAVGLYLPAKRQQADLGRLIERAETEYLEAVVMTGQYEVLRKTANTKKSVLLQEPLFSYVDKTTRQLKLTRRIDYVRPENRTQDDGSVTEVVHVSFKGITLHEFVRFLYFIEVQKREIFIKNISVKKDSKRNLNAQMTLQKRS